MTVHLADPEHNPSFTRGVFLGELGMMGLNIPEEYGGFGASALLFSRVVGEVATVDASLAVYFGAPASHWARSRR